MTAPGALSLVPDAVLATARAAWAATGRHSQWPVQGMSMWPLLRPGDVVEILHGQQGIEVGDVLIYQAEGRVVVHRLLRRSGALLLMGSDHLPTADAFVPTEAVIGRVIAVYTAAGRLDLAFRTARWLGHLLAARHPWRGRWGLRYCVRLLAQIQRAVCRR